MVDLKPVGDPLTLLPPEIVLKVLDFAPISALAAATRLSKAWHAFVDETHQDAIYSSETKTTHPKDARDFDFLKETKSFAKYFDGTASWKDLCKRQVLLPRNWDCGRPLTRESILQIENDPVWRFRPDYERRFFLSTSQAGGLNVTDMDSGRLLWRLPSTLERDHDAVTPYAHLEYQDGTAVWNREGNAVEVWKADMEGAARGELRQVAILPHDCQTRGFQLSYDTLCVVSTQGQGFVYDMKTTPPTLRTHLKIENDAVGHLDQDADVVMYSMGTRGYHVHNKTTGKLLGTIHPGRCLNLYHIKHPTTSSSPEREARHGPTPRIFPPDNPSDRRLEPIHLESGPLPFPLNNEHFPLDEDEWGAGMLNGKLMVGVSRHGRIFVCSDWRKYIESQDANVSSVVECESDGSTFELGGWLSVKDNRLMFEIQDRIYVLALNDEGRMQDVRSSPRGSYSLLTSSAPQLAVPVSFMGLYDDCIMTTYTTLGWRQRTATGGPAHDPDAPARIFPTKAIRIISLAPTLDGSDEEPSLWVPEPDSSARERAQTGLLQLVSMLGDDLGDDEDELGALAADFNAGNEDEEEEFVDRGYV